MLAIITIIVIIYLLKRNRRMRVLRESRERLSRLYGYEGVDKALPAKEFTLYRSAVMANVIRDEDYDKPGVYVLYNKTLNMAYVGQSKRVHSRVNSHLTGGGNGDVYADYKYGSEFYVSIYMLPNGVTLNKMEREFISEVGRYFELYNRTRGNRG